MGKTILIVEDEPDLREALKTGLSGAGFEVIALDRADDALRFLDQRQVDLVLLDLFTHSIHGTHFLERIKANPKLAETKCMVLTNNSLDIHRKKAMDLGADEYLIKSETPLSLLVEKVTTALNGAH